MPDQTISKNFNVMTFVIRVCRRGELLYVCKIENWWKWCRNNLKRKQDWKTEQTAECIRCLLPAPAILRVWTGDWSDWCVTYLTCCLLPVPSASVGLDVGVLELHQQLAVCASASLFLFVSLSVLSGIRHSSVVVVSSSFGQCWTLNNVYDVRPNDLIFWDLGWRP